jgi:hypothetical protein
MKQTNIIVDDSNPQASVQFGTAADGGNGKCCLVWQFEYHLMAKVDIKIAANTNRCGQLQDNRARVLQSNTPLRQVLGDTKLGMDWSTLSHSGVNIVTLEKMWSASPRISSRFNTHNVLLFPHV